MILVAGSHTKFQILVALTSDPVQKQAANGIEQAYVRVRRRNAGRQGLGVSPEQAGLETAMSTAEFTQSRRVNQSLDPNFLAASLSRMIGRHLSMDLGSYCSHGRRFRSRDRTESRLV